MASLNQNISNFYRVAQARDFSRDFQFRVMDISYLGVSQLSQDDLVYATAASLPDRQISSNKVPYMGLNFSVPGSVSYPGNDAYEITFYADEELIVRRDIYNWTVKVFNDATSNGNYGINDSSRITLALLDMTGNISQTYIMHGVYPIKLGTVEYDITGEGKVVMLKPTLAYQFWTPGTQKNNVNVSVGISTGIGGLGINL